MKPFSVFLVFAVFLQFAYAADSDNLSPAFVINESNGTLLIDADKMNRECALKYECRESENKYWFNCYYDFKDSTCRCFLGERSECRESLSSFASNEISGSSFKEVPVTFERVNYLFSVPAVRMGLIAVLAALIIAALIARQRAYSTPLNKAIRYHKLAEHHHNKGDEEKASSYYRLAEQYRKQAGER